MKKNLATRPKKVRFQFLSKERGLFLYINYHYKKIHEEYYNQNLLFRKNFLNQIILNS